MSEDSVFAVALSMPTAAERAAYLDEACKDNAALRHEVEALLHAHEQAGDFLAEPIVKAVPTSDLPSAGPEDKSQSIDPPFQAETPGTLIGPYKLLQLLGEGGMGAVYVAEQQQPVKRRVALKVIKPGMDTARVLARFAAERQALALMDHTNIAKVLDAGSTEAGRPYFVMELVKGVPITKYCDELHLPLRERLELFVPVCQAIQHAHQKGIIHRDIKPSNVLVCIQDGKPVPKVIDFGVAKALHQKLAERTMYTEVGAVLGTLEYMSPEQAELSALDIDTRADIYALGVLLYELLTGSTPLDRKRLKQAALTEAMRLIREEEPVKPSTRLTQSKDSLASLASLRRTEPGRLTKEVRGELDWIVMKCLDKDRTRRYETANGLARDVQRYLNDEAVEACPPSTGYRLRKFARKNRQLLATAAAFAIFLVLAALFSVFQAWRARAAELRALDNEAQASRERDEAVAQRQRAKRNYDLARQAVENYLSKITDNERLKEADLHGMRKELLESALPFYEQFAKEGGDDAEQAAERGRAYYRLGQVRDLLGEGEKAQSDFRKMETIFAQLVDSHPKVADYRRYLALSHYGLADSLTKAAQYTESDQPRRAALKIQKQLVAEYPTVPEYRKELADTHQALAYIQPSGSPRLALGWENEFRQTLFLRRQLVEEFKDETKYAVELCHAQIKFGSALQIAGRDAEAEREVRHFLEELERFPKQLRNTVELRKSEALAHTCLDFAYARQGLYDKALVEAQRALDIHAALAKKFPSVPVYRQEHAWMHVNLGLKYQGLRRWKEAEQEFLRAMELLEDLAARFPEDTEYAADAGFRQLQLAVLCLRQGGRSDEALNWCDRAEKNLRLDYEKKRSEDSQVGLDRVPAYRAHALAQLNRYPKALAEAQGCGEKPREPFHLACAYSLLSAAALQDAKLTPPVRDKLSEDRALRAIELLGGIDWKNRAHWYIEPLKTDKDLEQLRSRPEFRDIVEQAEKALAKPAGK
jgi:serine/threonine protein kinase/tetratricopeptide (TPR) repeat protein